MLPKTIKERQAEARAKDVQARRSRRQPRTTRSTAIATVVLNLAMLFTVPLYTAFKRATNVRPTPVEETVTALSITPDYTTFTHTDPVTGAPKGTNHWIRLNRQGLSAVFTQENSGKPIRGIVFVSPLQARP